MTPSHPAPPHTLGEIAAAIGAELVGDGSWTVRAIAEPADAGAEDLAIAIEPAALRLLAGSAARAALVAREAAPPAGALAGYLSARRPRHALALLLRLFDRPAQPPGGVHPTAAVEPSARLGDDVSVGAFVYVGDGAEIGRGTVLMPHVTVGAGARIGADCRLHPGARIGERVSLGDRVIVQSNACLGADGFSYATPDAGSIETARASGRITARNTEIVRLNSIGTVVLGDDVEVGANATIDRATIGATTVGRGTKIDNLVLVGHNTAIGENCLIAGQVGISGSCRIGDRVVLAGGVGIADHIAVGDDAIVMAGSGVGRDVPAATIVAGYPAMPRDEAFAQHAHIRRLGRMLRDLAALAKRVRRLEGGTDDGGR
ncbi:MAG TPA: UDP-3-O-(3-hydroxymyristoyl)glucosamine N-acyltransferase [Dongiaceae bacterium]|nr:UDP-3-O-(3-hydroxymyristoyl)glucosamine N-acyltransferase [Dongiaceae bacterium]